MNVQAPGMAGIKLLDNDEVILYREITSFLQRFHLLSYSTLALSPKDSTELGPGLAPRHRIFICLFESRRHESQVRNSYNAKCGQ